MVDLVAFFVEENPYARGCESTARDASTLGYRTVMVADANAANRDQDLNATLHTIYRSFGDVRPTSELVSLIRRA